jgi:hypothetical protein
MGRHHFKDEMAKGAETHPGTGDERPSWVIGPLGQRLTLDQLPPPDYRHWLPIRKAEVVAAVHGGLLTLEETLQRYNMTIEEYAGWERAVNRFGVHGLRQTRLTHYRDIQSREQKF